LKTVDNKQIVVPNAQIMNSIITNFSANETRRVDLVICISYNDDIDKTRTIIQELINADNRILKDPACLIAVSELADSSVNIAVRPWVKTADYMSVKFGLTEIIKKRFDKEGISFPFPQQDVHIIKDT
jgi:small conductance mechanosensitive channel